jgi:hypothetical protein
MPFIIIIRQIRIHKIHQRLSGYYSEFPRKQKEGRDSTGSALPNNPIEAVPAL